MRGDEAERQQLQQEWELVATQTAYAWKLQPAFSILMKPLLSYPNFKPALMQTPSNPQMARVMKLTLQMAPCRAL